MRCLEIVRLRVRTLKRTLQPYSSPNEQGDRPQALPVGTNVGLGLGCGGNWNVETTPECLATLAFTAHGPG